RSATTSRKSASSRLPKRLPARAKRTSSECSALRRLTSTELIKTLAEQLTARQTIVCMLNKSIFGRGALLLSVGGLFGACAAPADPSHMVPADAVVRRSHHSTVDVEVTGG